MNHAPALFAPFERPAVGGDAVRDKPAVIMTKHHRMPPRQRAIAIKRDGDRPQQMRAAIGHQRSVHRSLDQGRDRRAPFCSGKSDHFVFAIFHPKLCQGGGITAGGERAIVCDQIADRFTILQRAKPGSEGINPVVHVSLHPEGPSR